MTWVKVCGVRRVGDIEAAEEAGADAVGLVVGPSVRRLLPGEAADLAASTRLQTFLVTVDAGPDELLALARETGVTGVQPHGAHAAEAAEAAAAAGLVVLYPLSAGPGLDVADVPGRYIPLVDSPALGAHGGTGRQWDRRGFSPGGRSWVMAGGLGPGTVGLAVAEMAPWGVDASSRLESAPGVKDPALIAAFVREAKKA